MTTGVVMFSGGVESVATLDWAVNNMNFDKLVCVHNLWKDMEISGSHKLNPNIKKICDYYDVPLRVYEYTDPLGDLYKQDGFDQLDYIHSSNHWLLTAMQIAKRYPEIKDFMWGVNCGLKTHGDDKGDYPFLPRSWQFTLAFDNYVHNMGADGGQRLYPPASHLTKLQMWGIIPDEVKPLVQSCGKPLAWDGQSPCGECHKCNEFNSMFIGE
tara:strand:+ start:102 stop:737 length:636 start_codon:yes stop_codon:yes gene_type:complete